ncbi:sodium-dependent transporter, partial [Bacillus sp. D-CC]
LPVSNDADGRFFSLSFATLTSAISMLEIVVASVAKDNEKKRPSASLLIGIPTAKIRIPISNEMLMKELEVTETKGKTLFNIWFFLLRYVIPVTVIT